MSALTVRGLIARYGDKTILNGVDLTVEPGEVRVILGGSGCGKSTLMKCCVGLKDPDGGRVTMLGEELSALDEKAQRTLLTRIGVLFQYGALLGSISIGEN
ncbi:MAG: phospholipid/cholesterol/gamma-HCH transport system ATP-binding protein, partial [Bradymonadia bacterium]